MSLSAAVVFSLAATSPLVAWEGRTVPLANGSVLFDFSGVSARIRVNNSFSWASVFLEDNCEGGNKFVVSLAGEGLPAVPVASFFTRAGTAEYILFAAAGRASFSGAAAELTLTKAVEARFTGCDAGAGRGLAALSFASDGAFAAPLPRARRMEIIGDSITAGDLVYCTDAMGARIGEANSLWADNAAVSYGARLCAALNASCSTVAWGGMGLVANDVPSWTWPHLPDVYPSALGFDVLQRGRGAPLAFPYNASAAPPPDAVAINLGTNDASGGFGNATFAALFVSAYVDFAANISRAYQAANGGQGPTFFLGYGPMTTAYAAAVNSTVRLLNARGLRALAIDYSLPGGAACACGHPSADDHLLMAKAALPVIREAMRW